MDENATPADGEQPMAPDEHLGGVLAARLRSVIDGFPHSTPEQRASIARLLIDSLGTYAEECEASAS